MQQDTSQVDVENKTTKNNELDIKYFNGYSSLQDK